MRLKNTIWMLLFCLLTVTVAACSKDEPETPVDGDYPQQSSSIEHFLAARDGSPQVEEEWGGLCYVMKVPASGGVYRAGLSEDAARIEGDKKTSLTYWPFIPERVVEVIWDEPMSYPECLRSGEDAKAQGVLLCENVQASRFVECDAFSWVTQPQLDEFEVSVKPNNTGRVRQIHVSMYEHPVLQPFQFIILQAAE